MAFQKKLVVLGGGSARTPLLIHGLAEAQAEIGIEEVALYDIDSTRVQIIAALGREVARRLGSSLRITTPAQVEEAIGGAQYVISSLRVGGTAARARDEAVAREHGYAGQETTGPGGLAMALRTIPVTLQYARIVEVLAPDSWFINFTNPAGLVTQALTMQTKLRVIGICDTPTEIFHRIAEVLREPRSQVVCHYAGLNHLGWVTSVEVRGEERINEILNDDAAARSLYPSDLFAPDLLRGLQAIPTEYLFFYYSQLRALRNQLEAGATRGAEVEKLDNHVFAETAEAVAAGESSRALNRHADYLRQRSASYLRLESGAESASNFATSDFPDPFQAETGYHRMALEVITALTHREPAQVVVNVPNGKALPALKSDDVVEVPCQISSAGIAPTNVRPFSDAVCGLVLSVKQYERLAVRAAIEESADLARLALFSLPIVGEWESADRVMRALIQSDAEHLAYLKWRS
jgi:6-phospho-beta-glucosidase